MEFDNILDNSASSESEFIITDVIRDYLSESARWGKFIAIIGFVFIGLSALGALLAGGALIATELGVGGGSLFAVIYLAILLITAIPVYYLYQFATKMQIALQDNDQVYLQSAFANHKSMFKFYGIFMAIILGFYALAIVISLFAGLVL